MFGNQRETDRRLRALKHASESGNIAVTCRYIGIGQSTCHEWRARFEKGGPISYRTKRCRAASPKPRPSHPVRR